MQCITLTFIKVPISNQSVFITIKAVVHGLVNLFFRSCIIPDPNLVHYTVKVCSIWVSRLSQIELLPSTLHVSFLVSRSNNLSIQENVLLLAVMSRCNMVPSIAIHICPKGYSMVSVTH